MYFGGNNHGCQEYSKNLYKYTQADRLVVTSFTQTPFFKKNMQARDFFDVIV